MNRICVWGVSIAPCVRAMMKKIWGALAPGVLEPWIFPNIPYDRTRQN